MMSSVLAKIINQAEITFSLRNKDSYKANFMLLKKLVDNLLLSDLNLNPILFSKAAFQVKNKAPCTFINICERNTFSMSIFIMNENYKMPLHDHPKMLGLLKVISGQLKVESYTRIQSDVEDQILVRKEEPKILDERNSPSAVLFPDISNYHELTALSAPAAFFDILAPPYSDYNDTSENSRHCSFYKKMMVDNSGKNAIMKLVKIDVPDHYYCDSVPFEQPDFLR